MGQVVKIVKSDEHVDVVSPGDYMERDDLRKCCKILRDIGSCAPIDVHCDLEQNIEAVRREIRYGDNG